MKYRLKLGLLAESDIFAAAVYLAESAGEELARGWLGGIQQCLDSLKAMPYRCPLAHEERILRDEKLRQLFYGNYRIIFFVKGDLVEVVRVRHMAQDVLDDT